MPTSLGPGREGHVLQPSTRSARPGSTDDALSDRAEDEHGEVDEAADDHDHAEQGDRPYVEKLRQLTADIGARWHEVQDDDPARAIASFAQRNQITQIVIGSSQRSRWQQMLGGGSNVARVIREAGALGIDVHVIALRKTPPAAPPGSLGQSSAERPSLVQVSTPEESGSPPGMGSAGY
jgi:nucleotide-binding universal stress UspA family protein